MAAVKNTAYVLSRRTMLAHPSPSCLSPLHRQRRPAMSPPLYRPLSSCPNWPSHTFTLNTGDKIPAIGLGTWQSKPHEVQTAVEAALKAGYRHIDTASAYGNEAEVGAGIKASGVARDQIWLTTKLFNNDHKRVAAALDDSLAKLGVDYVDLYLIHWPASVIPGEKAVFDDWNFVDTWREMQKLVGTGKVKNIGVSNFAVKNLEILLNDPSCKVRFPGLLRRSDSLTLNRSSLPSTRSSCTRATRRPSSSRTPSPRAFTAPATRVWARPTRRCTQTTRSRRWPTPRARRFSRCFSSGVSRRAGASSPRASPRSASRPTMTLTAGA